MPSGVYIRTKKVRREKSKIHKKLWQNPEYREKQLKAIQNPNSRRKSSESHKGLLTGNKNPAKRPEVRRKISKAKKGITKEINPKLSHPCSEKTKEKIRKALKGRTFIELFGIRIAEERGKKHSKALKGKKKPPRSKRHRENLGKSLKGKYTGERSSNWKGGTCNFPYPFDFDNELKELIRKRDSYICQLCGKDRKKNKKNLSVHHIDYIKENLDPKNLITLCCSCNGKVNSGRKNWIKFFGLKLKIIYHNAVRV